MKIKSLRLENFQGIARAEFDFDGLSASIYGDNATGKTTIFNAVTWLLFDKASTGAKNFTPKTKGPGGDLHNLDHSAEAAFIMPSGEIAIFKKVYHEVWKKKRGSSTEEFDGHTVDFFIDGVPVKEKQYTGTLQNYCGGIERMKILTMPDYFSEVMPWDERRKILIELCGDVTDADVIRSSEELAELDTLLRKPGAGGQSYSVEEYKKIAAARKSEINKQLQALPGRIDEAQRAIPESSSSVEDLKIELHNAVEETGACRRYIDGIRLRAGNATKTALADARAELAQAKADYIKRTADAAAGAQEALRGINGEIREAVIRADDARADAERLRRNIERMTDLRESILQEYRDAAAETFDEARTICPTCGQPLPRQRVDELRADFNQRRSERLAAINARGKKEASKDMIASMEAEVRKLEATAAASDEDAEAAREKLKEAEAGIESFPPFEDTAEFKALQVRITAYEMAASAEDQGKAGEMEEANRRLEACLTKENDIRGQIVQMEAAERQRTRVAELEADEKRLGAEYESLDRGVWLCDEFTKAKVKMLTSRIDSKFSNVRFRLFQEQLNGGVKDDCEVLIPGDGGRMVPYAFANNAARINAGLEIIGVLADHWEMEMPVFIDNAESVTHLARAWTQTIRLVVSEQDKQLRLVLD